MRSRKQEERTEESVEKNGTIPQDGNTYLQQPKEEETNYSADCASFTEELAELDAEESRKANSKAKQARTGNLYQQEVQEQYKEVQLKRNKQSKSSISKKSRKRKIKKYHEQIIVSSSESDDWQPSEEEYISTDESECIKKSVRRKKLSSTMRKQTSDNCKKEGYEEEQSKLTTKKRGIDNTQRDYVQQQQSTNTWPTFFMPIQDQNTKKNEPKKIHKLQEYVPLEKKKKTDEIEIEIPKHIFTIMAQKLKEKHQNKTHTQPEKQEWKGTTPERKRMTVIYKHIPETLKKLMHQNVELTKEERVLMEGKIAKEENGKFKCLDCNERLFLKKYEAYHHVRIVHTNASIMHICGYGKCTSANNNMTIFGIHTVHEHFRHLFRNISIPTV